MNFRAVVLIIYLFFYLTLSFPKRLRYKKLEEKDPKRAAELSYLEVQKAFRTIMKIAGADIDAQGLENIPREAVLFVGNHTSYFDIVASGCVIPDCTGFVAKDTLKKIPGLKGWMDRIHCLYLDRTDIKKGVQMIRDGIDLIKDGYSMFIYPEGTRSKTGEIGEFKGGALKMAQRSGCNIVPVAIRGTRDIYENNSGFVIRPSKVKITFGQPFRIEDLPKEQRRFAADYTREQLEALLQAQND